LKFSDIESSAWESLKPFLDTCLLPLTGLSGSEQPWEAVKELERLRDFMDCIEVPYKGRIVTYPAIQYLAGPDFEGSVNAVCRKLREAGFRYVVVITANALAGRGQYTEADLLLCPHREDGTAMSLEQFGAHVHASVQAMWRPEKRES
jgi:hypothetical protein